MELTASYPIPLLQNYAQKISIISEQTDRLSQLIAFLVSKRKLNLITSFVDFKLLIPMLIFTLPRLLPLNHYIGVSKMIACRPRLLVVPLKVWLKGACSRFWSKITFFDFNVYNALVYESLLSSFS